MNSPAENAKPHHDRCALLNQSSIVIWEIKNDSQFQWIKGKMRAVQTDCI